jgi:hypothetical protein
MLHAEQCFASSFSGRPIVLKFESPLPARGLNTDGAKARVCNTDDAVGDAEDWARGGRFRRAYMASSLDLVRATFKSLASSKNDDPAAITVAIAGLTAFSAEFLRFHRDLKTVGVIFPNPDSPKTLKKLLTDLKKRLRNEVQYVKKKGEKKDIYKDRARNHRAKIRKEKELLRSLSGDDDEDHSAESGHKSASRSGKSRSRSSSRTARYSS